jgi:hypothetical protein
MKLTVAALADVPFRAVQPGEVLLDVGALELHGFFATRYRRIIKPSRHAHITQASGEGINAYFKMFKA